MREKAVRALLIAAFGLGLAACSSSGELKNPLEANQAAAPAPAPEEAGTQANAMAAPEPVGVPVEAEQGLRGGDPNDPLALGKKYFRSKNFGLAERSFRKAVELHPRDAEAWLGLAASYDRLRRFDLADRAYTEAIRIVGPTVEILNNQGYSYMLRGDYQRAQATLLSAQRKAPDNQYVANNLRLLAESARQGKAIQ